MLDIKLLTFLTVAETGSYTAAARTLHLTQPAVTQHIQKLEEHYGCKLFTPEGRGMCLTEQGEHFLHYAHMQQSNEKQLIEELAGLRQPLRIGSTLSIGDYYLPQILVSLLEKGVPPCQTTVANTEILLQELLRGNLDGAFIEGIFDRKLFEAKEFLTAPFIPVARAEHPLAGKEVSLTEVYGYPLILREKGSGTRRILESYLMQHNDSVASFAQIWEIGSFVLMKHLLERTDAVSFMYEGVATKQIAEGTLTPLNIAGYELKHELQFVYLKNYLEQKKILSFYQTCMEEIK